MAGVLAFSIFRFERTKSYVHQEDLLVGSGGFVTPGLQQHRRGTGTSGTVGEVETFFGVDRDTGHRRQRSDEEASPGCLSAQTICAPGIKSCRKRLRRPSQIQVLSANL